MDPQRQRSIASKGGKAAHAKGTAHEWSSDEARDAGRKGGEVVSRDRAHMAAIGREGGEARGRARARQQGLGGSNLRFERERSVTLSREGGPTAQPRREPEYLPDDRINPEF
jgi:general stress protein YciG